MTRQALRDVFIGLTNSFEGGIPYFYLDIRGIVTIAYGNAVFTAADAARLPLMHPGGVQATPGEIIAAWTTVRDDPYAAAAGAEQGAKKLTSLRLTREGMGAIALAKLDANELALRARLPDRWDDLPTCAQLALHSWAWACGAAAPYPHMFAALRSGDLASYTRVLVDGVPTDVLTGGAAFEVHINETTPEGLVNSGLIPRNAANKMLLRNAQRVRDFHLDPDLIDWHELVGVHDAPTVRDLENPASSPTIHVDPSAYLRPDDWLKGR